MGERTDETGMTVACEQDEGVAWLHSQLDEMGDENDRLRGALRRVSGDMHNTSRRPCSTCQAVTDVLGEPFGCIEYQAKTRVIQEGPTTAVRRQKEVHSDG